MRTRSQRMAAKCTEQMLHLKQHCPNAQSAYGTFCRRLPSLLLSSGLLQTVAFLESKRGTERDPKPDEMAAEQLLLDLEEMLTGQRPASYEARGLRDNLVGSTAMDYMEYGRSSLIASGWYKRLAESLLGITE